MDKKQLENLEFWYIDEIHSGVYIKKYAKDIAESEKTKAHHITETQVCFWSIECSDHACCISIKNILLAPPR